MELKMGHIWLSIQETDNNVLAGYHFPFMYQCLEHRTPQPHPGLPRRSSMIQLTQPSAGIYTPWLRTKFKWCLGNNSAGNESPRASKTKVKTHLSGDSHSAPVTSSGTSPWCAETWTLNL